MTPPLATTITTGLSTVQVFGKRSSKGWAVSRSSAESIAPIGRRKAKAEAIQLALDAAAETPGTYLVKPRP